MIINLINKKQNGFIALMATVVISLVLLVMAVESGSSGWYARFNILGTEAKEQASNLAEGCAEQALAVLLTDPNYIGGATTTTEVGTCYVFPIQLNFPVAGLVTIKTQGVVRESYANLNMAMNMNDIHFGSVSTTTTTGTLFITTHTINDSSGTSTASSFNINVSANPSSSFSGSESGVVVAVQPGTFSVNGATFPNYSMSIGSDCSGNIIAGQIKFCTITYDDITTTLTLVSNVVNNNSGTNLPNDFPLFIDGVSVALGQRLATNAGVHTVSTTLLSGYASSTWGYDCSADGSINMTLGQNKTCVINFDDLPPPAPVCAETVMMLDRTGSMSSTDLANEKIAASSLINLYSAVSPLPKVSVGVFGDGTNSELALASIVGQLTTIYSTLTSALNTWLSHSEGYTNLSDAITKSSDELNSSRHVSGKEKVLILISDGDPNRPTGSSAFDTGFKSATTSVQNAVGDFWNTPIGAYTDGSLEATSTASLGKSERYSTFGFGDGAGLPSGSVVSGIETQIDAWATVDIGGGLSTIFTDNFGTGSSDSDVPNWSESGSTYGTQAQAFGIGNDSVSPDGGRFALIEGHDGWICREVNAYGFSSLILKYYWRGDSDAEDNEYGVVEYNPSGSSCTSGGTWYSIESHELDNGNTGVTSWSTLQSINLPTSLNNDSSFFIRFRSASNRADESLRIDNVSIIGTYLPALACQIGVQFSWDGGVNWTSEKVQSLTGTETTYTLGSINDDWTNTHTWQPIDFSNTNFRVRVHAIDPGTGCDNSAVNHLDWLQLKVHYTSSTDPVLAALNAADTAKLAGVNIFTIHFGADPSGYNGRELLANLASGSVTVSGHQSGSENTSGGGFGDTGLVSPTAYIMPNQWSNPSRGYTSDNSYTTTAVNGYQQGFRAFNFSIPPTSTINRVIVEVEAKSSDSSGCRIGAEVSSNNGVSFTTTGNVVGITDHDTIYTLGDTVSLWNKSWTPSDFANGNFVVRLQNIDPGNSCVNGSTLSVDMVRVRIQYTSAIQENGDGDNFFVSPTSADMEGIFHFIGEQVCPALLNVAPTAPPTTGTIVVMTQVINNNGGSATSSDFMINVSADNPSQALFAGSNAGISITVNPGIYNITENNVSGYTQSLGATCSSSGSSGSIVAGEMRVCIITNDDIPPPPPPPNLIIDQNSWNEVDTAY